MSVENRVQMTSLLKTNQMLLSPSQNVDVHKRRDVIVRRSYTSESVCRF